MHPVTIARSAEHERFVSLYERHAALVLAYARRRIGAAEAEDVLAETFLVAWRRRDEVPDDALPWLYAVAGNVLRNRVRSERRRAALSARLAAESARLEAGARAAGGDRTARAASPPTSFPPTPTRPTHGCGPRSTGCARSTARRCC